MKEELAAMDLKRPTSLNKTTLGLIVCKPCYVS